MNNKRLILIVLFLASFGYTYSQEVPSRENKKSSSSKEYATKSEENATLAKKGQTKNTAKNAKKSNKAELNKGTISK